jgi:hypothetical protein
VRLNTGLQVNSLDGTGDWITNTLSKSLDSYTNWTVSLWIKPLASLAGKGIWGIDGNYTLYVSGTELRTYWAGAIKADTSPLTIGKWTNLVVTRSVNTFNTYVNGLLFGAAGTTAARATGTSFRWGSQNGGAGEEMTGHLALQKILRYTVLPDTIYSNFQSERSWFNV